MPLILKIIVIQKVQSIIRVITRVKQARYQTAPISSTPITAADSHNDF